MSDDSNRPEDENASSGLDLSGLTNLSLGPNWGSGDIPASKQPRARSREQDERAGGPKRSGPDGRPPARDRRGPRPPRAEGDAPPRDREGGQGRGERRPRRDGRGGRRPAHGQRSEAPFKPLLEADFYPDDAAFKALSHAIKTSCRTFELFEIAQLILDKPERWVCVARHPEQKEGGEALLVAAIKDGLPFLNEQDALNHVFAHYLGDFYDIEEFEGDPPSGSFQLVHRCGMTGELLAPPNYHRYATIVRDHHASRLAHVPFERFQQRIESVREEDAIQSWLEKMKKRVRYTLKAEFVPEGKEAPVFEQVEDARIYLISHHKDKLVRPAYSVRILGKDVHLLPQGDPLRRSIETLHAQQVHFPLDTANNLRGRLRRMNFTVYKKGSKGVSYVCAVKRHFREPGEVLAENLSDLIAFIEAHPDIKAPDLPSKYLGLSLVKGPEPESVSEEGESGEAVAPAAEAPADPELKAPPSEDDSASGDKPVDEPTTEEAPKVDDGGKPAPHLSSDQEQLLALKRDLRYLVTQGYVIEYSDGRLFVPPPREVGDSEGAKKSKPPREKAPRSDREKQKEKPEVPEAGTSEGSANQVEEPAQPDSDDTSTETEPPASEEDSDSEKG